MSNEIRQFKKVVYYTDTGDLEALLNVEGIWLNVRQICQLFKKSNRTISEHIVNIYNEGELNRDVTHKKININLTDNILKNLIGNHSSVTREISYYNINMVIAIGHRTKSFESIAFRTWAIERTNTYTEHLKRLL